MQKTQIVISTYVSSYQQFINILYTNIITTDQGIKIKIAGHDRNALTYVTVADNPRVAWSVLMECAQLLLAYFFAISILNLKWFLVSIEL